MNDPLFAALEEAFGLPESEREAFLRVRLADLPEILKEALETLRYSNVELELPAFNEFSFVGCMVGRYPLLQVIGRGAMGTVYRSRQESTEREVAVKLMPTTRGSDVVKRLRQKREILSSARLAHENIVRVLDAGYDETLVAHYSVMELVPDGRSLRGVEVGPREAARLMVAVCRALEHAHRAGIVHRDVKPGNILLTPDGTPKLTDFGLALDERFSADRLTMTDEFAGTPHYMSPEQVKRRRAVVDKRTDIYSAGAVLYELLTHSPPHEGQSSVEVFNKILKDVPRRLGASVPRDLAVICFKALRKEPDHRYSSAAEMAADLERFLKREPILARPEPVWRVFVRRARKHPVASGAALASCVLIPAYFVFREPPYAGSPLQQQHLEFWESINEQLLERLPNDPIFTDDE